MRHLIRGTALAFALVPSAVVAQTAADDVRCLIVSSTLARAAKDPRAAKVAQVASGFFLGRVDRRISPPAFRTLLVAQTKSLTPANGGPIMNACVRRMAVANRTMVALVPQGTPAAAKTQVRR